MVLETYCARSGIRNPSIVLHPAVVCTLLVSIGAVEHCPDVSHAVHTHSRAFEDGTERKQRGSVTRSPGALKTTQPTLTAR